jgi:hypothetical protein
MLLERDFALSVLTFNYDLLFESIFHRLLGARIIAPVEEPRPPVEQHPRGTIPFMHLHGGINHFLVRPRTFARASANPWLSDGAGGVAVANNASNAALTLLREPGFLGFNYFPLAPNLVPPGHQGDDICNPFSRSTQLSQDLFGRADLVVFCGLSAAEPDTDEVRQLVNRLRVDALPVQVGLLSNKDDSNDLAQMLARANPGGATFVDAGQLASLKSVIGRRFAIQRARWESLL